jgi:hypothetical protein
VILAAAGRKKDGDRDEGEDEEELRTEGRGSVHDSKTS